MMNKKKLLLGFLGLAFLILLTILFKDYFVVDSCLDQGGCWDDVDEVCRKTEPDAQKLCYRVNKR